MSGATLHADVGGSAAVEVRQIAKVVGPSVDAGARVEQTVQMLEAERKEPENVLVPVADEECFSGRPGGEVTPVEVSLCTIHTARYKAGVYPHGWGRRRPRSKEEWFEHRKMR